MRERRAIAGAVVAAVGGAGAAWGVLASEAGCQLQGVCDPNTATVSAPSNDFHPSMHGDVWQSGPIEGTWMEFPARRTYTIHPLRDGRPFVGPYTFPQVLISADPNPYTTPGSNFAPSAGNTAELSGLDGGGLDGFQVKNDTCSKYYLWLQVAQEYAEDGAAPVQLDASTPADAAVASGVSDADASTLDDAMGQ